MRTGRLNKQVTIQYKTVTRAAPGDESITWNDEDTVWGNYRPLRGKEYFAAMQTQSEVTGTWTIRYRRGLTAAKQLKYDNRIFEIVAVIDIDEQHRFLEIVTKEKSSDE